MRFELATRIVWHSPAAEAIVEELAALGADRVLVVSDAGIVAAGLLAPLEAALCEAGVAMASFTDVAGNPTTNDVAGALEAAAEPAAIVALGGGSVIDVAKAAAMLLANGGTYADYQWGNKPITARSLPMLAVPTTAGTGSEVTRVAVISDPARPFKKGVLSPLMFPHLAVIDPELTVGLPPRLTAATGMDALSHALEAYLGRRPSPLSDLLALEALRLIAEFLPRAIEAGSDREARRQMMLASLFGGIAMDQAGLGLIHALSGGVCSHLHLHHGEANAMLLPAVMAFNTPAVEPERLARVSAAFRVAPDRGLDAAFAEFIESIGLHVGLIHLGDSLTGVDWAAVAADSMQMAMIPNNPRAVTEADCQALLVSIRRPG